MKIDFKSAALGLVGGLAITAAAAAAQATQTHGQTHPTPAPKTDQATQGADHQRMMADPSMRQQMMERMRQCRDMMSQMVSRMEQMDHSQQAPRQQPQ